MNKPLKKYISDRFSEVNLSEEQLDQLQQMVAASSQVNKKPQRSKQVTWLAYAAGIFVALCLGVLSHSLIQSNQRHNLLLSIATEVAHNHIKSKPLDISSDNWDAVDAFFNQLDFDPINPAHSAIAQNQVLLGGRYCSIQGVTALQLRFKNNADSSTLYQGTLPTTQLELIPDIDAQQPKAQFNIKGLNISIWQSNNLVFAYVEPADV